MKDFLDYLEDSIQIEVERYSYEEGRGTDEAAPIAYRQKLLETIADDLVSQAARNLRKRGF